MKLKSGFIFQIFIHTYEIQFYDVKFDDSLHEQI